MLWGVGGSKGNRRCWKKTKNDRVIGKNKLSDLKEKNVNTSFLIDSYVITDKSLITDKSYIVKHTTPKSSCKTENCVGGNGF